MLFTVSNFYHLLPIYSSISKNYSLSFLGNHFFAEGWACLYIVYHPHVHSSPSNQPLPYKAFSCQPTGKSSFDEFTEHWSFICSFNQCYWTSTMHQRLIQHLVLKFIHFSILYIMSKQLEKRNPWIIGAPSLRLWAFYFLVFPARLHIVLTPHQCVCSSHGSSILAQP